MAAHGTMQVVQLYKGAKLSANLPYKVEFAIPQEGAKPVKLLAHLVSRLLPVRPCMCRVRCCAAMHLTTPLYAVARRQPRRLRLCRLTGMHERRDG